MGSIVRAACGCGFSTQFFAGSESRNYTEVCNAPAICTACGCFHVLNYLARSSCCPVCSSSVIFYNHPTLQEPRDSAEKGYQGSGMDFFILPRSNCLCPQCRQITMRFEAVSCCE